MRPERLDARQPLADLGLSSKDAVVVVGELREWLGEDLSPAVLWEHPTPRALARHLAGAADDAARPRGPGSRPAENRSRSSG
ncbi:Phthiocerol/phenolphthiocerol synthesis polyketide synthase type I PpsA [Streptomyces tendae]